jgi:hypothetical protein
MLCSIRSELARAIGRSTSPLSIKPGIEFVRAAVSTGEYMIETMSRKKHGRNNLKRNLANADKA